MIFIYSQLLNHHFTGLLGNNIMTTLRPYFHYCLSYVHNCEDRFHIHVFIRSSNMPFKYSQSFIHHFTGLLGTNIMTCSQLQVCSLAQLVEQCTGIAKVMGSNPV